MSKAGFNEDILEYINYMKLRMVWFGDWETTTVLEHCMKFYSRIKWFLYMINLVVVSFLMCKTEQYGLLDGSIVWWSLITMMLILTAIAQISGREQQILTMSLNTYFNIHDEPWMCDIRVKYLRPLKEFLKRFTMSSNSLLSFYLLGVPLVDGVMHYGFDALETPFIVPSPYNAILGTNKTWGLMLHSVQVFQIWMMWESVFAFQWFMVSYSLLTMYFIIELIIFKEQVKALKFVDMLVGVDEQIQMIVDSHNNIIRLNTDFKEYLGLSCAFMSIFGSLTMTLILFSCYISSDPSILVTYGSALVMYLALDFLICWLGQIKETESIEVFRELYNLPWYRIDPSIRKSLHMMMRQASEPLTTDYHGWYKMNLANFREIVSTSYQCFTLIRSITEK